MSAPVEVVLVQHRAKHLGAALRQQILVSALVAFLGGFEVMFFVPLFTHLFVPSHHILIGYWNSVLVTWLGASVLGTFRRIWPLASEVSR